jgi:hypothetical protein
LGACWVPLPRHAANIDEIMEVRWSDYYGAALFGDADQIACLRRKGSRLEIVATAESSHHGVNLLLPGHVLHYKGAFCFLDRFKLPNGTTAGLWHLVGFKLRLVSDTIAPMSREDAILYRVRAGSERKTRRWAASPCKLVQRVETRQSMQTRHGRLAAVFEADEARAYDHQHRIFRLNTTTTKVRAQ